LPAPFCCPREFIKSGIQECATDLKQWLQGLQTVVVLAKKVR
jgi:hypothetical protein